MSRLYIVPMLILVWGSALLLMRSCDCDPWPRGWADSNTLFLSYSAQIRNLDPSSANHQHEIAIVDNVVESPLAYHYLQRPYQLIPALLEEVPVPEYFDVDGKPLTGDPDPKQVGRVEYLLRVRPGIHFQPHPCFAVDGAGQGTLPTRELEAMDFKTALVRLCDPLVGSTVYSTFAGFIQGMEECSAALQQERQRLEEGKGISPQALPPLPDYRRMPLAGCQVEGRYRLRIILKRKYPQFLYWLAMHYTAPVPYEALEYYRREDVRATGRSWEFWPVGTGAFMVAEANPARRIVLERNPYFREMRYPSQGAPGDDAAGLLADGGKRLPFVDRVVFNFERESIPNWLKFQQGYYDNSGLPNDMFDNAVAMDAGNGALSLSPQMAQRGMKMNLTVPPISYYMSFNMLDDTYGGNDDSRRKLRTAIAMALDTREYVTIFRNGNGVPAEGIIPPGITGAATPPTDMNTVLNYWDESRGQSRRRDIQEARRLLAEAGYPGGVDPKSGQPLVLQLDHSAAGLPDFKNRFQWLAARLKLLGITLEERPADLNRLREKLTTGNWQFLFERGWVADYPDPENFLFLFYSANGHVQSQGRGPNYSNYSSPQFDRLFLQLETMADSPARRELLRQANGVLAQDSPVVWFYHPANAILTHGWLHNYKPSGIAYDTLKYLRVDQQLRQQCQRQWNRPVRWPVWLALTLFSALLLWRPKGIHASRK